MSSSKDVRNWIISLIILAVGIKAVMIFMQNYLSALSIVNLPEDIVGSVNSLGTLMIYGLAGLTFLLIIYYFSKRSDEKKEKGEKNAPRV